MGKYPHSGNVSLARALSKLGYCSRSQALEMIRDGRVTVDGTIRKNPSFRCVPEMVLIAIDGRPIRKRHHRYLVMNKPVGVITTRSDERGRNTVYHLLGEIGPWVFPVGRLDKDTSGLLLFTNDTRFGERLTNPGTKIPKVYEVVLDRDFRVEDKEKFEAGISVREELFLSAMVRILSPRKIQISLLEGKNRQIRRMCEAVGYEVCHLARVQIGGLILRDLEPGRWRYLTTDEVEKLNRASRD